MAEEASISLKQRWRRFTSRDLASFFEPWLVRRLRFQSVPIRIDRQRIYILPTGYGYLYAFMLMVMFLWAINYNNSMGFALTFLLGAVALNAMWLTHANLLNLEVSPLGVEPVFAGQQACFAYNVANPGPCVRYGIALQGRETPLQYADIPGHGSSHFSFTLPARRRGLLRPGRLRVVTRFPLGLFKAWSWIEFEQACIVYPRPAGKRPLPWQSAASPGGGASDSGMGSEDYAGLRSYVPGDSPRHIAWKAAARGDKLLVKRFTEQTCPQLWLDWRVLAPDPLESRLAQLCQWVLKAQADGWDYGLRLAGWELSQAKVRGSAAAAWRLWHCMLVWIKASVARAYYDQLEEDKLGERAINWLVVALASVMLPHLGHLPWWLGVVFTVAAAWRWQAASAWALPGRWLLLLATLAAVGVILYNYRTLFGRDAGVALLAAMIALKFLELRTLRDGMVLVFLGYFLAMANLLYTQSIPVIAYLLAVLLILLGAQVIIHRQHAALPVKVLVQLCSRMLFQSIPIMLVLFVLFPRISGPLWGIPKDAHDGLTGLSDSMSPGSISELGLSDAVAFRVRFDGAVPAPERLYWRGPALWRFDGKSWTRGDETLHSTFDYTPGGETVDYTVILEPHGQRWLFALDLPASLPVDAEVTGSFQVLRRKAVNEVFRYGMRSSLSYSTAALSPAESFRNLQLPAEGNPQARVLALTWRKQYSRPQAVVHAALKLFSEQPFHYTLRPPLLANEDTVDEFLFTTRRGFCEHYASSFVFLMRAAGIPARVMTGYQGGELNGLGDYLIVRQSDAHAWAEVWLEPQGWVRVDPTAAVAPGRIEQGLYAAVADAEALPFLVRRDISWLRQFALGWDSLNNAWNEWVLAYGPERQREFLSNLGFGLLDWRGMTAIMLVALSGVGLLMLGLYSLRQRAAALDPVTLAYQIFCTKLARRGLVREPHEGPLDFAERVVVQRPELAPRVRLIARLYAHLRFGRSERGDLLPRLRRLVKDFKA